MKPLCFTWLTKAHLSTQLAMVYRHEFVEPLLRTGLDFHAEYQNGRPAYLATSNFSICDDYIPRLLLSHGIYDEVVESMTRWTASSMMENAHVFDLFVQKFFPDFYQWPVQHRMQVLGHYRISRLDPRTIARIFHPDGRFRLDDLRRQAGSSTGKTVFERLLEAYFATRFMICLIHLKWQITCMCTDGCTAAFGKHDPGSSRISFDMTIFAHQWSEFRSTMREVVGTVDYSDLCAVRTGTETTSLLGAMALFRRATTVSRLRWGDPTSANRHRVLRHEIQEMVRDWLGDLQAAGKDLEVYGRKELTAFLDHKPSRGARWSFGSKKAGYKWGGFTVGPRPEDWNLRWDWDPDVEGMVGDFWACIEDPPLAVPGSWPVVDDDDDSCCSDDSSNDDDYELGPYAPGRNIYWGGNEDE